MSTLIIRPPSKAAADASPHWISLPCPWVLAQGDAVVREGVAPLAELADGIARAQRVVLVLAASDVTLLRAQVPPLTGARLRAALPNLLEDQLMSDPAESVFVPGPAQDGMRTVAVAARGWLEILLRTVQNYGARQAVAVPAQLCLAHEAGVAAANVLPGDGEAELALRTGAEQGLGLTVACEADPARELIGVIAALVPTAPVTLTVPAAQVRAYTEAAAAAMGLDQRITVLADAWPRWIAATAQPAFNLFAVLDGARGQGFDWKPWRWPAGLAAAVLLVNIVGLNVEWFRLKREADGLRAQMLQTYRAAFPRETVIVDPLAQMKQKIAAARRASGEPAPDDFGALTANFAAAWQAASRTPAQQVFARVDYKERALVLRPRPGAQLPLDALRPALAERGLGIAQAPDNAWQIRSTP